MPKFNQDDINYLLTSKTHGYFKNVVPLENITNLETSEENLKYFRKAIKLGLRAEYLIHWNTGNNKISFVDDIETVFNRLKDKFYLNDKNVSDIRLLAENSVDEKLLNTKYSEERLCLLKRLLNEKIDISPVLDPHFSETFLKDYELIRSYENGNVFKNTPQPMIDSILLLKEEVYDKDINDFISEYKFCENEEDKKILKDYIEDVNYFRFNSGLISELYNLESMGIDDIPTIDDLDSFEEKTTRDPWQNNYDKPKRTRNIKCSDIEERE